MAHWHHAMVGCAHEGEGLLEAYGRCLRLVHALGGGPAMSWLTDRVTAAVSPDRLRELRRDPLVRMVRERIRSVDEDEAALYRYLFTLRQEPPLSQAGIPAAIRGLEEGIGSVSGLRQVMDAEHRISEVWCDALEAPDLPRLTGPTIASSVPIDSQTALHLLTGDSLSDPKPLFALRQASRWDSGSVPVEAFSHGVPLWCADLVPPAPSFRELTGGEQPVPLAVLHGGLQDFPRWITPMVVSCDEQQSCELCHREPHCGSVMVRR